MSSFHQRKQIVGDNVGFLCGCDAHPSHAPVGYLEFAETILRKVIGLKNLTKTNKHHFVTFKW